MSSPEALEFGLFSFDRVEGLKEVYKVCFDVAMGSDYFYWKYRENPVGEVIAYIATDGGTVAAFYGVIPELYLVNGEPVKIYQSMDTMTHPNYQRRGLFGKLAKMTYEHILATEKALTIVGIPGTSSYPGFVNKLEWKDIHHFRYIFLPQTVYKMRRLFRRTKSFAVNKITEMDSSVTAFLAKRSLSDKPIQPYLFAEFFNWRVFKNRTDKYQVLRVDEGGEMIGLCLYSPAEKNRYFIHFLSFMEQKAAGDVLGSVLQFLFNDCNAEFVYTWEPTDSFLSKIYLGHGFLKNPIGRGPFSYEVPLIIYNQSPDTKTANWHNIDNYDLQPLMQD